MSDESQIPETPTISARRSLLDRVSVVWLVPAGALVVALGVAWQTWSDRGPLITIVFDSASDVAADQTELKFRDVTVGVVEDVGFTEDLRQVEVSVRLDKDVAPYVDDSAAFWVVRPEVSAQGVSGLNTVLGGVYIEGSWDADPQGTVQTFRGLDSPPVARPDQEGKRIVLVTDNGRGLTEGTPILYRGLEVGRVGRPRLAANGTAVFARAFIEAPHDRLLTSQTRFWDISGITFSLGLDGATVDFASVASLLRGGISFDTVVSGGTEAADLALFDVYEDRDAAIASLFTEADGPSIDVSVVFDENLPGLESGAAVSLGGIDIGEVTNLTGIVDPARFGDSRVRLLATLSIQLDAVQVGGPVQDDAAVLDFLAERVENGLRARLTNASILGGLKVELVDVPDAAPATLDRDAEPFPIIPTAPAEVTNMGDAAQGLLARIEQLPIEELLANAVAIVDNVRVLVSDPELQAVPADVRAAIGDVRAVVGSEAFQALPDRIGGVADDLSAVLADLREQEGVAKLVAAVEQAGDAAGEIANVAREVPDLIARIEAVAAKAEELDLQALVAEAQGVVADARALIGSEAAQAIPERLSRALDGVGAAAEEASVLLSDLTEADSAARLTAAVEAAGQAATDVSSAVQGLPGLIDQIEAVAAKANALALEDLVAQATGVVSSANTLLATEDAQRLPTALTQALDGVGSAAQEAQVLLNDLTEADSAARLTAAVEAAGQAAADVSGAVEGLPGLIDQIEAVAAKANALALEDLVAQATGVVSSANTLLATEDAQRLPAALTQALDGVGAAAQEAQVLLNDLTEADSAARLTAAVEAAGQAAADVSGAVQGLPGLIEQIEAVAAKANALPLEDLVTEAGGVVRSANSLLAKDSAQALPDTLTEAIESLTTVVNEASVLFADLNALDSADKLVAAVEAAGQAASDVSASVAGVPDLVAQIDAVAARAAGLPYEELMAQVTELVASADAVIGTDAARALPDSVRRALDELTVVLEDLREGGTVENVNATLASARRAADSIAESSDDLPALVDRVAAVLSEAQGVLAGLGESGQLNRDARDAMREVARAAEAVRSLARTLERDPNAILTGR